MCLNPIITTITHGVILNPFKEMTLKERIRLAGAIQNAKKENDLEEKHSHRIYEIPCGKCPECKREKRIEIIKRIKAEYKKNPNCYFITLTYDNDHLKSLNKKDIQDFIKRLRKKQKLRYFYVGELGETTARPHYHAIIWADLPEDIEECERPTKRGNKQYTSKQIQAIWKNGLITISKMELPLIGYITKYMLKNENKDFVCGWSRRPPIGINPNTIKEDIKKTQKTGAMVRYYKNHIGTLPKSQIAEEQRKIKIDAIETQTKMPYYQYIKQKRIF